MKYSFLREAQLEFHKAIVHYEQCREGLGREFVDEVEETIERVLANPERFPRSAKNTRRCRANRFPYDIIDRLAEEEIQIVAVMHLHRRPGYWHHRG